MPVGRPKIEIDIAEVERLASQGLTQQQIADALGVSDQTILNRKADSLDFLEAIKRGQAKGIDTVTNALYEQAVNDGSVPAAIFYLKNRAGWKDKSDHEINANIVVKVYERDGT